MSSNPNPFLALHDFFAAVHDEYQRQFEVRSEGLLDINQQWGVSLRDRAADATCPRIPDKWAAYASARKAELASLRAAALAASKALELPLLDVAPRLADFLSPIEQILACDAERLADFRPQQWSMNAG